MHRNYMNGSDISTNTHVQIDQLILGCMPWNILHLWGFFSVRDAGCRGNKITEFLGFVWWVWSANDVIQWLKRHCTIPRTQYIPMYNAFSNTKKYPVCPISVFWIICLRNKIRVVGIMPWCTFVKILFA